jgi:GNAT superfamily N-acetyltransferase
MALLRRPNPAGLPDEVVIEPLTPDAARKLRPSLFSRFSPLDLAQQAEANPGLAWVVRGQSQYAIGGRWRRRVEIGEVVEVSRGQHRRALLRRLLDAFDRQSVSLVVLDFEESGSDGVFYADEGFRAVERIVEYERRGCFVERLPWPVPIRRAGPEDARVILSIERESFPWLWWNSAAELAHYQTMPGVELYLSFEDGLPVGYAGITIRGSAGHLDRLAVHRRCQGRGHGAALLVHTLDRMSQYGVRRVTLSTQADNHKSRSLYERYGFRQGRWTYDIRGLWLREPEEGES